MTRQKQLRGWGTSHLSPAGDINNKASGNPEQSSSSYAWARGGGDGACAVPNCCRYPST